MTVPAGALSEFRSVTLTENGPATTFGLKKKGGKSSLLSISARPELIQFNLPVSMTVRWPDGAVEEIRDVPIRRFVTIARGRGVTAAAEPAR